MKRRVPPFSPGTLKMENQQGHTAKDWTAGAHKTTRSGSTAVATGADSGDSCWS